ncbi:MULTISPECIES: hypothetical protein [unclassified Microcoleus]|uniref:hypothetical protein n=1 Tax=unclassified Microcoleus TaxID=2642155 RepID=UPI002FD4B0B7
MSSAIAVGSGPIAFTTKDGQALLIPLTAISFENGAVKLSAGYSAYQAELQPWLEYLAKQETITAGETPPTPPALMIKATDAGIAGNDIQIEFKNVTPDPADPLNPAKTTFDAIVTEKETHTLSIDSTSPIFIGTILGIDTTPGSKQSLVHIKATPTPSKPKAGTYTLENGNATTKAAKPVDGDPSGIAFNLEAKKVGEDGNNTVASISGVDAAAKTFVMAITWTKTIAAIKLADLPAKLEGTNKYIITVTKPDGSLSGFTMIPSAGLFALNGGADKRDAVQASATIPAS